VLLAVGDAGDAGRAQPLIHWLGKPVLELVNRGARWKPEQPDPVARAVSQASAIPRATGVLSFDDFARCWVQERVLLDAIARCLPQSKAPGFARIAAAWDERNRARFVRSMTAIAEHLLYAAGQVQEVPGAALSMRNLVSAAERQLQAQARSEAMSAVAQRLERSAAQMFAALRALHGVEDEAAGALQHQLEEKFVVQQAIDTPQAGMAGAATGAAMGASVDLLVGGLTLGAATALGALVGGSAGFLTAAWKNRASATGSTLVQLSDEMMQAMTEAALLRYLAVAHFSRGTPDGGTGLRPFWKVTVAAAVAAQKVQLARFWQSARAQPNDPQTNAVAREVETIARTVLESLYPPRVQPR
jgi:hypothetical protein